MKVQTQLRVERIKHELLRGAGRAEVISRFSKEFEMAPTSISYFITMAKKQIDAEEKEKKELLAHIRKEQIEEMALQTVATGLEAEAFLTQILRGERMEEKIVYTDKGPEIMRVAPNISVILNALKMFFGRQHVIGKEKDVPMLTPLGWFVSPLPLNCEDEDEEEIKKEDEARLEEDIAHNHSEIFEVSELAQK